MLDFLVMEVLVLTVGPAVWPSVVRSARRACNTWSGWWTGGRSNDMNEEEQMPVAMNIQFTEEDLPQGSSIDIFKSHSVDDDNVQTKAKADPAPASGPTVDSSSRPTPPATAKANLTCTSTSTTRVEPVLTADTDSDTDSDATAAIIANGIKAAEAFKKDLAKAQSQDWQEEAPSKAKARAHASAGREHGYVYGYGGYAYECDHGYGGYAYEYDYGYGGYTIVYGPSGNQVSSAASGDFINSALEKAHYFQMDLARAQGKAVLKQYY